MLYDCSYYCSILRRPIWQTFIFLTAFPSIQYLMMVRALRACAPSAPLVISSCKMRRPSFHQAHTTISEWLWFRESLTFKSWAFVQQPIYDFENHLLLYRGPLCSNRSMISRITYFYIVGLCAATDLSPFCKLRYWRTRPVFIYLRKEKICRQSRTKKC